MEYSIVATVQRARRDVEKGRMQLVLVVVVVKGKAATPGRAGIGDTGSTHARHAFLL